MLGIKKLLAYVTWIMLWTSLQQGAADVSTPIRIGIGRVLRGRPHMSAATLAVCLGLSAAPDVRAGVYHVIDMDAVLLLSEIASIEGVRTDFGENIRGEIMDMRLSGSFEDILQHVSQQLDLEYFLFNGTYYISARNSSLARLVGIGDLQVEEALTAVEASGLPIDRFQITVASQRRAVVVTGPPKYIAFFEAVIQSLPGARPPDPAAPPPVGPTITIRRGTSAEQVPLD